MTSMDEDSGSLMRPCEGYCGGRVAVKKAKTVPGGERFCPECYSEWKRREYYDD